MTIRQVIPVNELNLHAIHLKHLDSKAEHIHISKNDTNNSFLIGVSTPSRSDCGEAHVLEHITLSRSKKFHVKDPFFMMNARTVSNYMNAYTATDHTGYLYSTENFIDYANLANMYLDAVLQPLLTDEDFLREAWRYEHTDIKDTSSPVTFKGVVFNEMLGIYSDSSSHYYYELMKHIYKGTSYSYESSGYPNSIIDLTPESVRSFYNLNYPLCKLRTASYGDFPLADILNIMSKNYEEYIADKKTGAAANGEGLVDSGSGAASAAAAAPANSDVSKSGTLPSYVEVPGPMDLSMGDEEHQYTVSVTYMLENLDTHYNKVVLYSLIESLMISGADTPMYQAIIESNLASGYVPNTGYLSQIPRTSFTIAFRGIKKENVQVVRDKISEVIKEAAKNGFERTKIEAFYHRTLVSTKTISTSFGLNLLTQIIPDWLNGIPLEKILDVKSKFDTIKKVIDNTGILSDVLQESFIDNKAVFTMVVYPKEDFIKSDNIARELKANETFNSFTSEKKKFLHEQSLRLLELQDDEGDKNSLPIVPVDKLLKDMRKFEVSKEVFALEEDSAAHCSENLYYRFVTTSDFSYLYMRFDLTHVIPVELISYLDLYAAAFGSLRLKDLSLSDLTVKSNLLMSKFSVNPIFSTQEDNLKAYNIYMGFEMGCLRDNMHSAVDLMFDIMFTTDWTDKDAATLMLKSMVQCAYSNLVSSGTSYASKSSSSHLGIPALYYKNKASGLPFVELLSSTLDKGEEEINKVLGKLQEIHNIVTKLASLRLYVISESSSDLEAKKAEIRKAYKKHGAVETFNPSESTPKVQTDGLGPLDEHTYYGVDSSVAFTSMSITSPPYKSNDSIVLDVLCSLIREKYLHKEIREKLGAYGSGCALNALNGALYFYSYRTPADSILKTFSVFEDSMKWALDIDKNVTEQDLYESVLSTIKVIDAPVAPKNQGLSYFYHDLQYENSNERRKKLLSVVLGDIKAVAQKYLVNPEHKSMAVVGPESCMEEIHGFTKIKFKQVLDPEIATGDQSPEDSHTDAK